MKMSVYVPDDLWAQVQERDKDFRVSPFLQQALRDRFGARSMRPYATLGAWELERAADARKGVMRQQTEAYRVGYQLGLDFARDLPWRAFGDFSDLDWDPPTWRAGFDDQEYELTEDGKTVYADWGLIMEYLLSDHENVPLTEDDVPKGIWGEGFFDAIRDLWEGKVEERGPDQGDQEDQETIDPIEPSTEIEVSDGDA